MKKPHCKRYPDAIISRSAVFPMILSGHYELLEMIQTTAIETAAEDHRAHALKIRNYLRITVKNPNRFA